MRHFLFLLVVLVFCSIMLGRGNSGILYFSSVRCRTVSIKTIIFQKYNEADLWDGDGLKS